MSKQKIALVTFGNSRNYTTSLQRLKTEAQDVGWFDHVFAYNENDIERDFWNRYGYYIMNVPRGFGYWIWKPQIILQALTQLQDGDLLWYLDCGCSINPKGEARFKEYNQMVNESSTENLGFSLEIHMEKTWTKGDLFQLYPTVDKNTRQMISGIFCIKKSDKTVAMIKEWADVMLSSPSFNDDSPSKTPNDPSFREHRHDQSSFSLIRKTRGCVDLIDETWPGENGETWEHEWIMSKPFHAKRIKG